MLINLFKLAPQDQSVLYLGQIFGYVGSVLPVTHPTLLIGILFKVFNTMALTIGALLVVYVTVVGLLKTAQEGEFLGRQWNSLWVPVRTVMGIVSLFPTSTGYSAIQIIIMWIILQGVGAADVLWTKVIEFVKIAGSPYAGINQSSMNLSQVQANMVSLFQGLMCQASSKATYDDITVTSGGTSIKYYCHQTNISAADKTGFCALSDADMLNPIRSDTPNVYNMGPATGKCGQLTYCDVKTLCSAPPNSDATAMLAAQNSPSCITCKAQRAALQAIVPALGAVASKVVSIDYLYARFYETPRSKGGVAPDWVKDYCSAIGVPADQCCVAGESSGIAPKCSAQSFKPDYAKGTDYPYTNTSSSSKTPIDAANSATDFYLQYPMAAYLNGTDFINAAVGEYGAAMVGAYSESVQNQMDKAGQGLTGWYANAQSAGWILAGTYYYKIAGENKRNQEALYLPFSVSAPDATFLKGYRNNYSAVKDMLTAMRASNAQSSPGFATNMPAMATGLSEALEGASHAMLKGWMDNMTNNSGGGGEKPTNPLISVATFGYQMMITAQLLFWVTVALVGTLTAIGTINPMFFGTGLTMSPIGEAIKAVFNFIGPFFVLLISAIFGIGALLGIYVPLIPYMIFTLGAIGWLIATVEAMVAGPIIALGILSPGGQHEILGRAEHAMTQMLNLFLRPSLMIFGMMASMFMAIVVVNLVGQGFAAATQSVMKNPGLVELILYIALYTSFIVTALNKAFSLIYVIPERVTTWIGGHAVSYGEEQAMGGLKQAVESAASGMSGSAKEAGGTVAGGVMAVRGAQQATPKGGATVTPAESGSGKGGGGSPAAGGGANAAGGGSPAAGGGEGGAAAAGKGGGGGAPGGGAGAGSGNSPPAGADGPDG